MATGTFKWYRNALTEFLSGDIDYLNTTIKVMLLSSAFTASQDGHDFLDDISANQITGTGYTAGGKTLGGKSITASPAGIVKLIASDVAWTTSTIAAKNAVLWASLSATASLNPLIGYLPFSATVTSSAGTFTLDLSAEGFLKIDAS